MLSRKIKDDSYGIAETVAVILALAGDPRPEVAPNVRSMALWICHQAGATTDYQRVQAIFKWLRDHIQYVRDPSYREFVQPPLDLITEGARQSHMAAGDCDDFATLAGALCGSLGIPYRICLSEDPSNRSPGEPWWAHVYCEALVKKKPTDRDKFWIPLDASMFFLNFGERVLGRTTHIYPGDMNVDILLDGAQKPGGLGGYVTYAIDHSAKHLLGAMRARTTEAKLKGPVLESTGIDGSSSLGFSFGGGVSDVFGALIKPFVGLTTGLISADAAKTAAKQQAKVQMLSDAANERLASKYADLDFQANQLAEQRAGAILSEKNSFDALQASVQSERRWTAALIVSPFVFYVGYKAYNWVANRKKSRAS